MVRNAVWALMQVATPDGLWALMQVATWDGVWALMQVATWDGVWALMQVATWDGVWALMQVATWDGLWSVMQVATVDGLWSVMQVATVDGLWSVMQVATVDGLWSVMQVATVDGLWSVMQADVVWALMQADGMGTVTQLGAWQVPNHMSLGWPFASVPLLQMVARNNRGGLRLQTRTNAVVQLPKSSLCATCHWCCDDEVKPTHMAAPMSIQLRTLSVDYEIEVVNADRQASRPTHTHETLARHPNPQSPPV